MTSEEEESRTLLLFEELRSFSGALGAKYSSGGADSSTAFFLAGYDGVSVSDCFLPKECLTLTTDPHGGVLEPQSVSVMYILRTLHIART